MDTMSLLGNLLKIVLHDRTRVGIRAVLKSKTLTYREIESGILHGCKRMSHNDPKTSQEIFSC